MAIKDEQLRNKVLAWLTRDDAEMDEDVRDWLITEINSVDCLKDKSAALLEILKRETK